MKQFLVPTLSLLCMSSLSAMQNLGTAVQEREARIVFTDKVQEKLKLCDATLQEITKENQQLKSLCLQQQRELNYASSFLCWQRSLYTRSAILLAGCCYSYVHYLRPLLMNKKRKLKPSFKRKFVAFCALDIKEFWPQKKCA